MTVWIARTATHALLDEANDKAPLETGGILLGYIAPSNGDAVVTATIGPGPAADHTRTSFTPDADHHERELARRYEASGRLHTYLGDWHSHPPGGASLSPQDLRTLRRIALYKSARISEPLMIVAHNDHAWELTAWQLTPRKGRVSTPTRHTIRTWTPERSD
jgi:integrative and conjugative element protein (TIGR02256 family)